MPSLFQALWSVSAIVGGLLLLLFREEFIQGTERGFRKWYAKTGFFLFQLQAENTDSTYMRMVIVLVAVGFILVGISTLMHI
jgi:hypothetical protein